MLVHGRSPLREVGGGNDHKFRPALVTRHRRLRFYSRSEESFSTVCETRPVADISFVVRECGSAGD
jgi:hypothetical protein